MQYYSRDCLKAMKLARLLADLERRCRDDVCLLFVQSTECPRTRYVDDTVARCSEVFHVERLVLRPDTEARRARWLDLGKWPVGPNVLWSGAAEHFLKGMHPRYDAIFFVDGGDGVPLHRDWLDVLRADHAETVRQGLQVTGAVFPDAIGRWHVNGNMAVERSFLADHPEVVELADSLEAWDAYYAKTFLAGARASSLVRCDWRRVGAKPEHFPAAAECSAWWHGCKDGNFVDLARAYLCYEERPVPRVLDFGRAADLAAGGSRC